MAAATVTKKAVSKRKADEGKTERKEETKQKSRPKGKAVTSTMTMNKACASHGTKAATPGQRTSKDDDKPSNDISAPYTSAQIALLPSPLSDMDISLVLPSDKDKLSLASSDKDISLPARDKVKSLVPPSGDRDTSSPSSDKQTSSPSSDKQTTSPSSDKSKSTPSSDTDKPFPFKNKDMPPVPEGTRKASPPVSRVMDRSRASSNSIQQPLSDRKVGADGKDLTHSAKDIWSAHSGPDPRVHDSAASGPQDSPQSLHRQRAQPVSAPSSTSEPARKSGGASARAWPITATPARTTEPIGSRPPTTTRGPALTTGGAAPVRPQPVAAQIPAETDSKRVAAHPDTRPVAAQKTVTVATAQTDSRLVAARTHARRISAQTDTQLVTAQTDTPLVTAKTDTRLSAAQRTHTQLVTAETDTRLSAAQETHTHHVTAKTDTRLTAAQQTDSQLIAAKTQQTDTRLIAAQQTDTRFVAPTLGMMAAQTDTRLVAADTDLDCRLIAAQTHTLGATTRTDARQPDTPQQPVAMLASLAHAQTTLPAPLVRRTPCASTAGAEYACNVVQHDAMPPSAVPKFHTPPPWPMLGEPRTTLVDPHTRHQSATQTFAKPPGRDSSCGTMASQGTDERQPLDATRLKLASTKNVRADPHADKQLPPSPMRQAVGAVEVRSSRIEYGIVFFFIDR